MVKFYIKRNLTKGITRIVTCAMLGSVPVLSALAIPASNEIFLATQPDGSSLEIRLHGDEFFHYTTTADGYVIMQNPIDKFYYYAQQSDNGKVDFSNIRVRDIDKRTSDEKAYIQSADTEGIVRTLTERASVPELKHRGSRKKGPGLFEDATFPTTGKQKAIVILVEYTDVKFRVSDPYDYFSRLLNEEGFSDYESTGSARDYYLKSSEGKFDIDFDVYGPVTLPYNQAHYGANGMGGSDGITASTMVVDACNIIDKDVDFTQYDRDNDGVIDNVFLFYAGLGEDSGGGSDAVWPHSADAPRGYSYDGKNLNTYGCTNEWVPRATGARPDGIGAFCHEFGHVLGLPDLYKTTSSMSPSRGNPFTPGGWSLMDRGSHNNERRTPPVMDLFSRYALGWYEPEELNSPKTCILNPLTLAGEGYIVKTGNENEFYLIENRQKTGWDSYVPGHGLLVWHIEYNPTVWSQHAVNNDESHQYVDIIEADGILTEETRSGDAFPGTANVTELTRELYPALSATDTFTDITENPDGTVTFKFRGGSPAPATVETLQASDITPRSFKARWTASEKATDYRIRVYTRTSEGVEKNAAGYENRLTGNVNEIEVSGLEPSTQYYYTVRAVDGATESAQSTPAEVNTAALTHAYVIPTASEATDITENSFTANWEPIDGTDGYRISVSKVTLSGKTSLCEAFDDKTVSWNTNTDKLYTNANYVGKKAPSLRLAGGEYVASPVLEHGTIRSLSFWHRANMADDAKIRLEAYARGCWQLAKEITPVSAKGGVTTTVYEFPEGTDAVRIILDDPTGLAAIYVDDIEAVTSKGITVSTLEDYDNMPTGNSTSLEVSGLEGAAHYHYTVKAVKENEVSMDSKPIHVLTSVPSGVEEITTADDELSILIYGTHVKIRAGADTQVAIYDVNGMTVATTVTDNDGHAAIELPSRGIFIVKAGMHVCKVAIR